MQTKPATSAQTSFLMPTLGEQLDPRQPLKQLADTLPWVELEQAFGKYYSPEGRPAKPVRLMVGLLLLKQMFNQGDETVVAAWVEGSGRDRSAVAGQTQTRPKQTGKREAAGAVSAAGGD